MTSSNKTTRKKSSYKKVSQGIVHIKVTFNNTIVTITDDQGNKLCQSSSGACGFKGARKSTPYAAQMASEAAIKLALEKFGLRRAAIKVTGPGPGRESAMRAVKNMGVDVSSLEDCTPLPHNGCRPKKKRRV
jgi:small subunit ribosomal protein S11